MKNALVVLGTLLLIVAILFGMSRQSVSGQAATATPAEEATDTPTEEATEEATEEPTQEATEEATEEAAEEATDAPDEEATAEAEEEATATAQEETPGEDAQPTMTLAEVVRQSTEPYQDVQVAQDAGYGLFHGCVSGPNGGAMGVHYANGDFVGDGEIVAENVEALIYEAREGGLHLVGVEYVVLAEAWDANNDAPPVLMGQLFSYTSAPNRYGLPSFYSLHVWAWKENPDGMFADWNPDVSCEEYTGDPAMAAMDH